MHVNVLWLKYLPRHLRIKLEGRHLLQRLLSNVGWLVADKIMRLGVGLFVGAWMARYLGPQSFGLLSYGQAIVVLFSAISTVGLPEILVRDLVRSPERESELVASAFIIRLFGAAIAIALSAITVWLLRPGEEMTWLVVAILALAFFAQAMDVIDSRYQALVNVRSIVLLRNLAFFVFSFLKIGAIILHATLLTFAWLLTLELFVVAALMYLFAHRQGMAFRLGDATWNECLRLLHASWPLLLRLLATGIYMRIDQIMISRFLGDLDVGQYSAAVRVSELWYLVLMAIATAFSPTLTESHKQSTELYEGQLLKIMRSVTWMSIIVAILLTLLAPFVVSVLYGQEYQVASNVLMVHAWAGIFVAQGVCASAWFINMGLVRYALYQALAGAIVSILLNLVLIPRFGILGAAYSVVISQFVAAIAVNVLFKRTRRLAWLQLRAFYPP